MCNLLYLFIYRIITTRQYYFKLMDNSLNKTQSVYNLKIHTITTTKKRWQPIIYHAETHFHINHIL